MAGNMFDPNGYPRGYGGGMNQCWFGNQNGYEPARNMPSMPYQQRQNYYNQNGSGSYQQMPMQQQRNNSFAIAGRLVASLEEINPNEVPPDGSIAVFPTQDMSRIFVRQLGKDGIIRTRAFIPEAPGKESMTPFDEAIAAINTRLDAFDQKLSTLMTPKEDAVNV